jgi:N-acetylneuraminic acid mutarotase
VYDSATNTWTTKASMPTARYGMASGVIAGKLYVAGGSTICPPCLGIATLEVYDPALDTWTTKTSMPTARNAMDGAVINGKFYVVGGTNGEVIAFATLEVYDPATDAWTLKASMPTPRWGLGAGVVNDILYAVGGYDGTYLYTVEAYDPATNVWTTMAPAPTIHVGSKPQGINGVLYVAADGAITDTRAMEAFTPPVPPDCSAAYANPASLWAPNHKFIPITILGVTDPENDPVTITVIGVKQDEPVKSPGSGNMSPDAVIQGGSASVRSERDGNGNGRVYHLTFQADDGHGGTCTGDVTVGVPHSLGKGMIAIDDGSLYDSTLP